MKQQTLSEALLRRFLLGEVDDQERGQIETLFFLDAEAKRKVLNAEQDLIEDYLDDSLTPSDRKKFLSVYARTAAQRQRLMITKSIKEWAAVLPQASPVSGGWRDVRERLRFRSNLFVPITAAIAIGVIIAAVWLHSRTRQERLFVEQELARLNTPASLREVSPRMVSLDLSPVTLRSTGGPVELKTGAGVQVVELRLPWFQKEDSLAFEVEIRRVGDDESFTIRQVPVDRDGRYATRIRLPARILRPGGYQIRLSVVAANGARDLAAQYQFTVAE